MPVADVWALIAPTGNDEPYALKDVKEIKYMTLEIKRNATETTIQVVGRLDIFTAPALGRIIDQNARTSQNIVLELSGLEAITDAGLRALLDANERIPPTSALRLTALRDDVMNTLKANGCADAFTIN